MFKSWLQAHWVAGAVFMSFALLLLVPVGIGGGSEALLLIFLASPVYMLHQVEEHTGDRFRAYINGTVFGGVQALSVADVLWINLPGVWGLNFAALYAAHFIDVGWGVAAGYLILLNGIAHIGMAIRFREYNPGLVTGVLLFVPFGLALILLVPATYLQNAVGFAIALAVHAAIALRANHNALAAREAKGLPISAQAT
ncbi:MAG: HXXEE domain-containing protein [Hyphomicrobium sp.]|uniref:HXXEE domain-containing protein n=1 Tax=Hyphomicrobium sp. TaxID=82 RepID=UPI0039E5081A